MTTRRKRKPAVAQLDRQQKGLVAGSCHHSAPHQHRPLLGSVTILSLPVHGSFPSWIRCDLLPTCEIHDRRVRVASWGVAFFSAIVVACALLVTAAASADAQSDHPPIIDFVPDVAPLGTNGLQLDGPARRSLASSPRVIRSRQVCRRRPDSRAACLPGPPEIWREEFALAIEWLANVYEKQGRHAEAEPLYRHCLDIREK
jgi:Tetratricopeptide repeat